MRNKFRSRGNKYGRKKTESNGHIFDSKLEAAVYNILTLDKNITSIDLQSKVYLTEAKILAKIDFRVELLDGTIKYIEAKGKALPVWNIKKRLWKKYGPNTLEIWGGSHLRPGIIEVIHIF